VSKQKNDALSCKNFDLRRSKFIYREEHRSGEQIYVPYPALSVDALGTGVVSHAGAVTLLRTAEVTGLTGALSQSLSQRRKTVGAVRPRADRHRPTVSLALGGDCLADIATLHEHTAVLGKVPSDPTVSRLITALA
jgi:hypothetical protein